MSKVKSTDIFIAIKQMVTEIGEFVLVDDDPILDDLQKVRDILDELLA